MHWVLVAREPDAFHHAKVTMLLAILLAIAPLFLPVLLELLGLLIGQVQAYIFAVLATVYIASASSNRENIKNELKGET